MEHVSQHSRRSLLTWLAGAMLSGTAKANPAALSTDAVKDVLSGFRKTSTYRRRYSVSATVTALGIRIFSRSNVGGGYVSAEFGENASGTCTALQFAAGSLPERAGSLNRFGMLREAISRHADNTTESAFAGFITSSKEESLGEARRALRRVEGGVPLTIAWGYSKSERAYVQTAHTEVSNAATWKDAEEILDDLLKQEMSESSHEANVAGVSGFLAVMRAAGVSTSPSFRRPFLHNGKVYELHTQWRGSSPRELTGELRNQHREITAEFRALYDANDSCGLPARFDYNPRSFLRLTFETDPTAAWSIPSLLVE